MGSVKNNRNFISLKANIKWIFKDFRKMFFTICKRPKFTKDIEYHLDYCIDENSRKLDKGFNEKEIAIVVQGGIRYDNDFTFETLKLYKKNYPNVCLILSTWDYEDKIYMNKIKQIGVNIVINKFPKEMMGFINNNLQLISSKNAIIFAKKEGFKYILKTRTDQRIYSQHFLHFFYHMLKMFPLKIETIQKERIICSSLNSFKNRYYCVCDVLFFGYIDDLERYFSCDLDNSDHSIKISENDILEYCKQRPGEIYYSTKYFEKLGYSLKWTIEDSLYFFKEFFIVTDPSMIDLYFPKYFINEYRYREYKDYKLELLTFMDWVNLQTKTINR